MAKRLRLSLVGLIFGVLLVGCGSVAVRPGLSGHLIEGTSPSGASFSPFLQLGGAGGDMPDGKITHTPIEVTQASADEEFWQFEVRAMVTMPGFPVGRRPLDIFPVGDRGACEAARQQVREARTKHWGAASPTDDPCKGPHYFKRVGPPEALMPGQGVR